MIHGYIQSPGGNSRRARHAWNWALPTYRSSASLGTRERLSEGSSYDSPVHQKLGVGNFDQDLKFSDMVTGFPMSSLVGN